MAERDGLNRQLLQPQSQDQDGGDCLILECRQDAGDDSDSADGAKAEPKLSTMRVFIFCSTLLCRGVDVGEGRDGCSARPVKVVVVCHCGRTHESLLAYQQPPADAHRPTLLTPAAVDSILACLGTLSHGQVVDCAGTAVPSPQPPPPPSVPEKLDDRLALRRPRWNHAHSSPSHLTSTRLTQNKQLQPTSLEPQKSAPTLPRWLPPQRTQPLPLPLPQPPPLPRLPAESPSPQLPAESPSPQLPAESPSPQLPAESPSPQLPAESPSPQLPAESPSPQLPAESPSPQLLAELPSSQLPQQSPSTQLHKSSPSPPLQQSTSSPPQQQLSSSPPLQQLTSSPPQQQRSPSPPLQQRSSSPPQQPLSPSPPVQQRSSSPPVQQRSSSPPQQPLSPSPPQQQLSSSPPQQPLSPSPPQQQLSSSPPLQQLSPSPPQQQRSSSPPQQQLSPSPPQQQRSPSPPQQQRSSSPPQQQLSSSPPQQQLSSSPPLQQAQSPSSPEQQSTPSPPQQQQSPSPPQQQAQSPSPPLQKPSPSPPQLQLQQSPLPLQQQSPSPLQQQSPSPPLQQPSPSPLLPQQSPATQTPQPPPSPQLPNPESPLPSLAQATNDGCKQNRVVDNLAEDNLADASATKEAAACSQTADSSLTDTLGKRLHSTADKRNSSLFVEPRTHDSMLEMDSHLVDVDNRLTTSRLRAVRLLSWGVLNIPDLSSGLCDRFTQKVGQTPETIKASLHWNSLSSLRGEDEGSISNDSDMIAHRDSRASMSSTGSIDRDQENIAEAATLSAAAAKAMKASAITGAGGGAFQGHPGSDSMAPNPELAAKPRRSKQGRCENLPPTVYQQYPFNRIYEVNQVLPASATSCSQQPAGQLSSRTGDRQEASPTLLQRTIEELDGAAVGKASDDCTTTATTATTATTTAGAPFPAATLPYSSTAEYYCTAETSPKERSKTTANSTMPSDMRLNQATDSEAKARSFSAASLKVRAGSCQSLDSTLGFGERPDGRTTIQETSSRLLSFNLCDPCDTGASLRSSQSSGSSEGALCHHQPQHQQLMQDAAFSCLQPVIPVLLLHQVTKLRGCCQVAMSACRVAEPLAVSCLPSVHRCPSRARLRCSGGRHRSGHHCQLPHPRPPQAPPPPPPPQDPHPRRRRRDPSLGRHGTAGGHNFASGPDADALARVLDWDCGRAAETSPPPPLSPPKLRPRHLRQLRSARIDASSEAAVHLMTRPDESVHLATTPDAE